MADDLQEPVPSGTRSQIPLLPLRDILVFPSTVVPLFVGRDKSIQALEQAMAGNKEILLAAQIKAKTNEPTPDDIYRVGTISTILQLLRLPDGTVKVLVEGRLPRLAPVRSLRPGRRGDVAPLTFPDPRHRLSP